MGWRSIRIYWIEGPFILDHGPILGSMVHTDLWDYVDFLGPGWLGHYVIKGLLRNFIDTHLYKFRIYLFFSQIFSCAIVYLLQCNQWSKNKNFVYYHESRYNNYNPKKELDSYLNVAEKVIYGLLIWGIRKVCVIVFYMFGFQVILNLMEGIIFLQSQI